MSWKLNLGGAGSSLRALAYARTQPRRLKPAPLKQKRSEPDCGSDRNLQEIQPQVRFGLFHFHVVAGKDFLSRIGQQHG